MLYIVRHGKTDWNKEKKLQGRTDIPLNKEGREAAKKLREDCSNLKIDFCYSSPLKRARETAKILMEGRNVPVIIDERLIEMSFGVFEGTKNYLEVKDTPISVLFQTPELYKTAVDKGETIEDVYKRIDSFLDEEILPKLTQGKNILIVGHLGSGMALVNKINNTKINDFWNDKLENCKIKQIK